MAQKEPAHVMSLTEFTQTRRAVDGLVARGGSLSCSLESALTMADLIATIDHLREVIRGQKHNPVTPGPLADLSWLTVDQVDRLAQERPPYPPPSPNSSERCPGRTGWHRPQSDNWNRGDHSSVCTWCLAAIQRRFGDGVWRTVDEDTLARDETRRRAHEAEQRTVAMAAFIEGAMDEHGHVDTSVRLKFHTPGKYCQRCENDKDLYGTSFYNLDTREHYLVMSMVMVKRPAAL